MSILICKNCGGITNTALCELSKDLTTSKCYAKWVDGKWVIGCNYDTKSNHFMQKFAEGIIKKSQEST